MMQASATAPHPHSNRQRAALITLAVSAGAMPSLQPLLLGAMLDSGHVGPHQVGHAAAIEALGMALAILLAPSLTFLHRAPIAASAALLTMIGANIATSMASGVGVVLCRAVAGGGEGVLLWLFVRAIALEANPARIFAIYISMQSLWGFAISTLISRVLVPHGGAHGVYLTFAGIDLALLALVRLLPQDSAASGKRASRMLPAAGVAGLIGVALFLCGIMAFWSYSVPLLREMTAIGIRMETVVPFVIGVHVLGGLGAVVTSRISPALVCAMGPVALILCMSAAITAHSLIAQYLALFLFAFTWMFVPPFQVPLLIAIDPSARAVSYLSGAHLVGLTAGPFLASVGVTDKSVSGAFYVAVACLSASAVAICTALRLGGRATGAPPQTPTHP